MDAREAASGWDYWQFRHPSTGAEVQVHPLDIGMANIYVRHGWDLLVSRGRFVVPTA